VKNSPSGLWGAKGDGKESKIPSVAKLSLQVLVRNELGLLGICSQRKVRVVGCERIGGFSSYFRARFASSLNHRRLACWVRPKSFSA